MKFKVKVIAVQENESVSEGSTLGTVIVSADTIEVAQSKARDELWDSRLDAASCLAVFETVQVAEGYQNEMAPMEFLVTIQHGDDEDTRDNIVCDVTSADEAEAMAMEFGGDDDVRIVAVYQRVR